MVINLNTPLPKGKYKGKTILEIAPKILVGDWDYIGWIINNWNDVFTKEVTSKYGWYAYCQKTKFGSIPGLTNNSCYINLV